MKNKIVLTSKRLNMRYFSKSDLGKVFQMSQEKGMKKWLPDQFYQDKKEAAEVIRFLIENYAEVDPRPRQRPFVLGIELKEKEELIGHIGLSPINNIVEVGYAIEEKYQGSGYATEALKKFSDWAKKELNLEAIWGIVDKDNLASGRVLEKSGYLFDEIQRNKKKYHYNFLKN